MSQSEAKNFLLLGTFNSERFWRDDRLTRLPALNDSEADNIVMAMDELLFVMCQDSDILITHFKLNNAFKDYISELGFSFINNGINIISPFSINNKENKDKSACQLLLETNDKDYYQTLLVSGIKISPYSVLPCTIKMCKAYGILYDLPEINIVKKVNSKIYSKALANEINANIIGRIAYNHQELQEIGREYLRSSPIVIKDEYGVSGKGNVLAFSDKNLQKIVKHIAAQEHKGGYTQIIVEPFLDKELDFSCQLYIDAQGNSKILSIQKIFNNGFAYQGSCKAEDIFIDFLTKCGYVSQMEKVAKKLYEDGYFGYVCVDSMLLKNGQLVPIVEVNARKSMGLINHHIDEFLSTFSLQSNLVYLSLGYSCEIEFHEILTTMQRQSVLFHPDCKRGIIPLSANTLFINRELSDDKHIQKVYKGRFYVSVVGKDLKERGFLLETLRNILVALGFRVYN